MLALVHVLQHIKTLEFGAEKGLLQGHARRQWFMPLKKKKNPSSQKGFSKSPGGGRWGVAGYMISLYTDSATG